MKKTLTCLLLSAALLPFALPTEGVSQDRETLTNRGGNAAQNAARNFFKRPKATPRPAKRMFVNTVVYRYEDRAYLDHDRVSSPEIIFHVRKYNDGTSRIVAGHAFDYK
ncbi:MAG: hypothetical protein AAGF67_15760 [Verrucomicrobiota bacterium]